MFLRSLHQRGDEDLSPGGQHGAKMGTKALLTMNFGIKMGVPFLMIAVFAMLGNAAPCRPGRELILTVPHALNPGETAWIVVKVGAIGRAEIEFTTPDYRSLGTISPFGIRSGSGRGTYTLPLPSGLISDGHVTVCVSLNRGGHAKRAPTKEELKEARVKIQQAAR